MATVRPGRPADRPRLREIQAAALAEPWPALLDLAVGDGPHLSVVEADGSGDPTGVVGYVVALTADATAYVPEIAVHPDAQGAGYGSTLVESLLDTLGRRGVESVRLTVRESDTRARAFYEDHGFAVADRVLGHFESGDGLVLVRRLDPGDP